MKLIAALIVGSFLGFIAAWQLFQPAAPVTDYATPPTEARRPAASPLPPTSSSTDTSGQRAVAFADIEGAASVFDQLYTAWQLAAQANSPRELEQLLDQALDRNDPLFRHNVASVLLERYVELDPEGAMAFVDREYRFDQVSMKGHVLTSWVRYDPEAALAYLRNIADQRVRITAGARLLEDPTLLASGLRQEVVDLLGDQRASQILNRVEMQRADPAELFASARLMSGNDRRSRMQFAIARWAEQDPEAALGSIESLGDDAEKQRMLQIAISTYSQLDPEAALEYLQLNHPDNEHLMIQPINVMANRDVTRALQLAEEHRRRFNSVSAVTYVLRSWANENPTAAIQYASTLPVDDRRQLFPTLAHTYMQRQPAEAMRWLLTLDDEFSNTVRSALQIRNDEALRAGEQILPTVSDPTVRQQIITSIAMFKSSQSPQQALDWLSTYQDEPAYGRAMPGVLAHLARNEPERAARFIDSNAENRDIQNAAANVAQSWYQRSPDDAVRWLRSMPDSPTRSAAISSVASMAVSQQGLDAAASVLDLLPEGNLRDNAARQIAMRFVGESSERADEAIRTLSLSPEIAEQLRARANN